MRNLARELARGAAAGLAGIAAVTLLACGGPEFLVGVTGTGADGGPAVDASAPDAFATDASAPTDGSPPRDASDATSASADGGDGAVVPFSCATLTGAAVVFCSDFDQGTTPPWNWDLPSLTTTKGKNAVDLADFLSAPHGYAATTQALLPTDGATFASLQKSFTTSLGHVDYTFQMKVKQFDPTGLASFPVGRLVANATTQGALFLDLTLDKTGLTMKQLTQASDGGTLSESDPVHGALGANAWVRVDLILDRTPTPWTITVLLDGVAGLASQKTIASPAGQDFLIGLGIIYLVPQSGRTPSPSTTRSSARSSAARRLTRPAASPGRRARCSTYRRASGFGRAPRASGPFPSCRTFSSDRSAGSLPTRRACVTKGASMTAASSTKPTPRPTPVPPSGRSSCVYGDSTVFPHEGNFIETIRHAVDCSVSLLAAQQTIHRAIARASEVDRARHLERARLEAMNASLKRTLAGEMPPGAERLLRAGSRILDASRVAIEGEILSLETAACNEITRARRSAEEARAVAQRAVETFLLHHDLPGSEVALRLTADEERYGAVAHVATPFGVEASFELQIPDAHEWGQPRRVGDLNPGTEVHIPLESGLFFKKVAVQPVKLDRLFVNALHVGSVRGAMTLRRQPTSGSGYKIDFDAGGKTTKVLIARLGEDGMETPDPVQELSGEDAVHVLRLWQRVLDSTEDLSHRRQSMTSGTFDGHRLRDLDEPRLVAEKIIRFLTPIVREISKRSCAPGELVLRRDVRAGRRDEIYITKAELQEKVLTLPPLLRGVFDPFELDSPRSPRAPAPSLPAYSEVEAEEVLELSSSALVVAVN